MPEGCQIKRTLRCVRLWIIPEEDVKSLGRRNEKKNIYDIIFIGAGVVLW